MRTPTSPAVQPPNRTPERASQNFASPTAPARSWVKSPDWQKQARARSMGIFPNDEESSSEPFFQRAGAEEASGSQAPLSAFVKPKSGDEQSSELETLIRKGAVSSMTSQPSIQAKAQQSAVKASESKASDRLERTDGSESDVREEIGLATTHAAANGARSGAAARPGALERAQSSSNEQARERVASEVSEAAKGFGNGKSAHADAGLPVASGAAKGAGSGASSSLPSVLESKLSEVRTSWL
eukprot:4922728-Pleurochrysis_carterae.AAC.2